MKRWKIKMPIETLIGKTLIGLFLAFFCVIIILPFWTVFIKSFMSDTDIMNNPLALWPTNFQLEGYVTIFTNEIYAFGQAFFNSVYITFAGTVYQLIITTLTAYALSRRNLRGKKVLMFYFLFTMYFSGGMIPYYLVIKELDLRDTLEVMYLPAYMSMFNMLVMRSYFLGLPQELEEAAKIDGVGNFRIFLTIILPLSSSVLATIALFISVGLWNNWYTAMLFITSHEKRPMAYALQVIIDRSRGTSADNGSGLTMMVGESIQYAGIVVSVLPIMCVYPFLQKHFTKGVLIGSIKG